MDESVKLALAKWPNVPSCTGWLALDRRGNWRMRDEAAQRSGAAGSTIRHPALLAFIARNYGADEAGRWFFQNGPQRVYVELAYTPWIVRLQRHPVADGATGPIAGATASDDASSGAAGRDPDASSVGKLTLTDQCGGAFEPVAGWLDDAGSVLFSDASGRLALLHDHDLDLLTDHTSWEDAGNAKRAATPAHRAEPTTPLATLHWRAHVDLPLAPILAGEVEQRFGFVRSPAASLAG
jgi:hypothetical protein